MNPTLEQVVAAITAAITPLFTDGAPGSPAVVPPVATSVTLPDGLTSRTALVTTFPWVTATRKTSPAVLNEGNVWLVKFTAGPSQSAVVTLQAAEAQGGQIARYAVLIRDRDGAVLWRADPTNSHGVSTISAVMSFDPNQPTGIFAAAMAHPVIVTGEAYTLAIWNVPGGPAGLMLAELVL